MSTAAIAATVYLSKNLLNSGFKCSSVIFCQLCSVHGINFFLIVTRNFVTRNRAGTVRRDLFGYSLTVLGFRVMETEMESQLNFSYKLTIK